MDFAHFLILAAGLSLAMTLAWGVQRLTGSSGWIDAIWSFSVGGFGVCSPLAPPPAPQGGRALLVAGVVGLWALRLGTHIALRSWRGGDDPRYAALARQWGEAFPRRLLLFLQVQALVALVLVAALRLAATNPAPFPGPADFLALVIASVAIVGESLADAQLQNFRRRQNDAKAICETGLWRWSRHPNYFFEWLFWLACPLLAIDLSGKHVCGWLALAAPVLMYVLLAHVSGVPPLEAHMLASRGESFRDLQRRVNAFFPGPRHENQEPSS
jgi:steroid 5-alpha reductase family enzyme